jgi:hypothetical protein
MQYIIHESKNYDQFELLPFNRSVKKTAKLEQSMREEGFITAYPLHCVKNGNGKLKIKSGHHRFYVARKLGIPAKYVVCDDNASIYKLEGATVPWSLMDYCTSHELSGKAEYQRLLEYHAWTGIPINMCAALLMGYTAKGAGGHTKSVKEGTYKVNNNSTYAYSVAEIVLHCKKEGIIFAINNLFVNALSRVVWVNDFDVAVFKEKISRYTELMKKQATMKDYMLLIEQVYNHNSKGRRLPVVFLADEIMRQRQVGAK